VSSVSSPLLRHRRPLLDETAEDSLAFIRKWIALISRLPKVDI
jgi:hypothetical protein